MDEKQYNLSASKSLFLFLILPFPGHSGAAFSSPHEGHSSLCPALYTMTAPAAIILFLSHSSSVLEVQMSPDFQDQSCSSLHLPNKKKNTLRINFSMWSRSLWAILQTWCYNHQGAGKGHFCHVYCCHFTAQSPKNYPFPGLLINLTQQSLS